jgi:trimethylamine--corrinoid protein Co-methyltransferase
MQNNRPYFHILTDAQIQEIHEAALDVIESGGVAFNHPGAREILQSAGVDVSDPQRIRIPSNLVEQALEATPKAVEIFTREGAPAMTLNCQGKSHFGAAANIPLLLDPYTGKQRTTLVEDIATNARLCDGLSNISFFLSGTSNPILPPEISDQVELLQLLMNSSKPIMMMSAHLPSWDEIFKACSIIAGGEDELKRKPFVLGSSEPVSPLVHGLNAMEVALKCADKGIPCVIYGMPMAGGTAPATFSGCLTVAHAEVLSQLAVLQLKHPGTPVIYGSIPSILDMKTMIFSYGAPELALMGAALCEVAHSLHLPMFGVTGNTDAHVVGLQAGAESIYQILVASLAGIDMVRSSCFIANTWVISPEYMVLGNELVDMAKVLLNGIEVNKESLAVDLIERVGPGGSFLKEKHTFDHFRDFWMPRIFDRTFTKTEDTETSEEILKRLTIEIIESHQPIILPDDMIKELKALEKTWFKSQGLDHKYPNPSTP